MLKNLFSYIFKMTKKRSLDCSPNPSDVVPEKIQKMRRRSYILLMMYSGRNYYGMQRLKEFPSIEEELLKAMLKANMISEMNYNHLPSIRFQRCSKTDRGVSALGQLVSANLNEEIENQAKVLNQLLPEDIRIIDVFRGTKNFNPKSLCESREYVYFMPSFALRHDFDLPEDELAKTRITAEKLTEFNEILSHYLGTKFYFNFTSGRTCNDQSCNRYMTKVECGQPFLIEDREFVCITIVGQSFMLHQIRKMIGLAIAVITKQIDKAVFIKAFQSTRIDIPKAPGLGLVLSQPFFPNYNERHCSKNEHKPIIFDNYKEERDSFRAKNVLPYILQKEVEEKIMYNWLQSLPLHSYDERDQTPSILKIQPENIDDPKKDEKENVTST